MDRLKAPQGGCIVRMYRQGLGDCFLLAFGASQRKQKYVLIDCGVLLGTNEAEDTMRKVVKDIHKATGGHLDALVITHEHWDHVSGFNQAQEEFKKFEVEQVWLAWTENPRNPLAHELRNRRRAALCGLRIALAKAAEAPPLFVRRIRTVAEFFGPDLGLGERATTEDALDWVKRQWPNHRYCDPGGVPLSLDGLPDVKFYVLGPPANIKYIQKSRPSSREGQVYFDDASHGELGLYLASLGSTASKIEDRFTPFNTAYQRRPNHPDVAEISERYQREAWRQIDKDWTGAAGELALKLDEHTNNTSLVLAIELAPKDKVLLFPGDAQVGNWMSWEEVKWNVNSESFNTQDLLSRTVLYKVGHHGSHNATLREKGLEYMTNEELVAMIPVDREIAKIRNWRMPHGPLHDRLLEKTMGRLVLSDTGLPIDLGNPAVESFRKQSLQNDLYIDYTVTSWKSAE